LLHKARARIARLADDLIKLTKNLHIVSAGHLPVFLTLCLPRIACPAYADCLPQTDCRCGILSTTQTHYKATPWCPFLPADPSCQ
jgi:hypothetical protein